MCVFFFCANTKDPPLQRPELNSETKLFKWHMEEAKRIEKERIKAAQEEEIGGKDQW